jgi:hypothetical protein
MAHGAEPDVPVQDPGILIAVPTGAGTPEEALRDLSGVERFDEDLLDVGLDARLDQRHSRIDRHLAGEEGVAGVDQQEPIVGRVGAQVIGLELEQSFRPDFAQRVLESVRLRR